MISMDLIFKVQGATQETTINLDLFLNTIESIRVALNHLSNNSITYDFKHTSVSSFKISVDIHETQQYGLLFDNRKEKFYDKYSEIVQTILNGQIPENFKETRYKSSIKKLFRALAEQSDDVELIFEDKEHSRTKVIAIKNERAKHGYVQLKKYLSDKKLQITTIEGNIYDISLSKKTIGIKEKKSNKIVEFKIDNIIASMFIKKEYELHDEVAATLEKQDGKKQAKLIYIKNITKNSSFPKRLFE